MAAVVEPPPSSSEAAAELADARAFVFARAAPALPPLPFRLRPTKPSDGSKPTAEPAASPAAPHVTPMAPPEAPPFAFGRPIDRLRAEKEDAEEARAAAAVEAPSRPRGGSRKRKTPRGRRRVHHRPARRARHAKPPASPRAPSPAPSSAPPLTPHPEAVLSQPRSRPGHVRARVRATGGDVRTHIASGREEKDVLRAWRDSAARAADKVHKDAQRREAAFIAAKAAELASLQRRVRALQRDYNGLCAAAAAKQTEAAALGTELKQLKGRDKKQRRDRSSLNKRKAKLQSREAGVLLSAEQAEAYGGVLLRMLRRTESSRLLFQRSCDEMRSAVGELDSNIAFLADYAAKLRVAEEEALSLASELRKETAVVAGKRAEDLRAARETAHKQQSLGAYMLSRDVQRQQLALAVGRMSHADRARYEARLRDMALPGKPADFCICLPDGKQLTRQAVEKALAQLQQKTGIPMPDPTACAARVDEQARTLRLLQEQISQLEERSRTLSKQAGRLNGELLLLQSSSVTPASSPKGKRLLARASTFSPRQRKRTRQLVSSPTGSASKSALRVQLHRSRSIKRARPVSAGGTLLGDELAGVPASVRKQLLHDDTYLTTSRRIAERGAHVTNVKEQLDDKVKLLTRICSGVEGLLSRLASTLAPALRKKKQQEDKAAAAAAEAAMREAGGSGDGEGDASASSEESKKEEAVEESLSSLASSSSATFRRKRRKLRKRPSSDRLSDDGKDDGGVLFPPPPLTIPEQSRPLSATDGAAHRERMGKLEDMLSLLLGELGGLEGALELHSRHRRMQLAEPEALVPADNVRIPDPEDDEEGMDGDASSSRHTSPSPTGEARTGITFAVDADGAVLTSEQEGAAGGVHGEALHKLSADDSLFAELRSRMKEGPSARRRRRSTLRRMSTAAGAAARRVRSAGASRRRRPLSSGRDVRRRRRPLHRAGSPATVSSGASSGRTSRVVSPTLSVSRPRTPHAAGAAGDGDGASGPGGDMGDDDDELLLSRPGALLLGELMPELEEFGLELMAEEYRRTMGFAAHRPRSGSSTHSSRSARSARSARYTGRRSPSPRFR
eukprot:PLAT16166.1.p1 GENE.PLAT16166.1~~PLAT16166.1.p1  ORF type:complete len:1077 (+),score=488.87 PLAT16166.1:44-3274(+)